MRNGRFPSGKRKKRKAYGTEAILRERGRNVQPCETETRASAIVEETHNHAQRKVSFGKAEETQGVRDGSDPSGKQKKRTTRVQRKHSFGSVKETHGSVRGRTVFVVCPYDKDIT